MEIFGYIYICIYIYIYVYICIYIYVHVCVCFFPGRPLHLEFIPGDVWKQTPWSQVRPRGHEVCHQISQVYGLEQSPIGERVMSSAKCFKYPQISSKWMEHHRKSWLGVRAISGQRLNFQMDAADALPFFFLQKLLHGLHLR